MKGVEKIIDVGPQGNGFFPRDRTAYLSRAPGAYGNLCCIDANDCLPLPESVSDIEASTLLEDISVGLHLSQATETHHRFEDLQTTGTIVLTPDD
jgi:NADPH:quinone reductase-like Zn-dependent oxidoreductase